MRRRFTTDVLLGNFDLLAHPGGLALDDRGQDADRAVQARAGVGQTPDGLGRAGRRASRSCSWRPPWPGRSTRSSCSRRRARRRRSPSPRPRSAAGSARGASPSRGRGGPSRPGPMFSTSTSAVLTRSRNMARPRSDFRLSVTPFLFELSSRKNHASSPRLSESAVRPGSPVGGSILMTSAPSHAEHLGAARSRLVLGEVENANPVEGLGHGRGPPLCRVRREPHGRRARLGVGDDVDHRRLARGERALERRADVVAASPRTRRARPAPGHRS